MENEIQPDITLAQPSLRSLPIIQPSANWSKILLFTVLGLIIVASSVFVGVQIGKNQKPSQQPVAKQQTAAPTQAIANLTIQPTTKPTTDPTANWKTYINTEANYYFKYPQNWTIVSNCKFGTICFSMVEEVFV
jgi:hypothetical protein